MIPCLLLRFSSLFIAGPQFSSTKLWEQKDKMTKATSKTKIITSIQQDKIKLCLFLQKFKTKLKNQATLRPKMAVKASTCRTSPSWINSELHLIYKKAGYSFEAQHNTLESPYPILIPVLNSLIYIVGLILIAWVFRSFRNLTWYWSFVPCLDGNLNIFEFVFFW